MLSLTEELKKTPLYQVHLEAGAKMVPFGGWAMPVQYRGILEEHRAVRERAGLFDVSHMGEIMAQGPGAFDLIQGLITNDISKMVDGQAIYSPMCNRDGGVLDDLLVFRLTAGSYMLVVNAANTAGDFDWIREQAPGDARLEDISDQTALLAIQGPLALEILKSLAGGFDPVGVRYYNFVRGSVAGMDCLVSRTGYTGEDGFELYVEAGLGVKLWQALMEAGSTYGIAPVGLGARDTLRFEASLPLYGHELDQEVTPLEAGLGRFVKFDKGSFNGRETLLQQRDQGPVSGLKGLSMADRGIPRAGFPVMMEGQVAGRVTSGSYSPTLDANLAMAYLPAGVAVGEPVAVLIRNKEYRARVVPMPFYKRRK